MHHLQLIPIYRALIPAVVAQLAGVQVLLTPRTLHVFIASVLKSSK